MLKVIKRNNVKILPGLFRERYDVNINYLLELDTTCLLQNFYIEAGIILPGMQVVHNPTEANLHWGWEAPVCQLRGHFLGHWLSAAAAVCASENNATLKAKLDFVIDELARCQELCGGMWVGPIPEKYFELMAKNIYVWSPQYVMHKTIMGLVDSYRFAESKKALDIVSKLADWYVLWVERVSKFNPAAIYGGEQAGMLEMWAQLYELTGDEKYLTLAKAYMNCGIFDTLDKGGDALSNDHANASIPYSHGSAKMYEITGDEKWKERTLAFWDNAVTNRGMLATSGQNAGEFWIPPHSQGEFLSESNQEFCTVYNMVRTASYLFKWTGDKKYADYIERALYNGFLAQQDPSQGTPTYFLPLTSGAKKKFGSKRHDFWCCHGTMVQAQTLYPELIYFADKNKIIISQYIPSKAELEVDGERIIIGQSTDMKSYNCQTLFDEHSGGDMSRWSLKFSVNSTGAKEVKLLFRLPWWVSGNAEVSVNDEKTEYKVRDGYIELAGKWANDTIRIFFPSKVVMERLPDEPMLAAAVDGPIVLAGLVEKDVGLKGDFDNPQEFLSSRTEHTYSTFPWKQNCYVTKNQDVNFTLKPLYEITDERYTVYFTEKKA